MIRAQHRLTVYFMVIATAGGLLGACADKKERDIMNRAGENGGGATANAVTAKATEHMVQINRVLGEFAENDDVQARARDIYAKWDQRVTGDSEFNRAKALEISDAITGMDISLGNDRRLSLVLKHGDDTWLTISGTLSDSQNYQSVDLQVAPQAAAQTSSSGESANTAEAEQNTTTGAPRGQFMAKGYCANECTDAVIYLIKTSDGSVFAPIYYNKVADELSGPTDTVDLQITSGLHAEVQGEIEREDAPEEDIYGVESFALASAIDVLDLRDNRDYTHYMSLTLDLGDEQATGEVSQDDTSGEQEITLHRGAAPAAD